jgi:NADH-quinone oxidoreductase subunit J
MVLFLFVIMLLSLSEAEVGGAGAPVSRLIGALAAVALFVLLAIVIGKAQLTGASFTDGQLASFGTLKQLGDTLYHVYLLPFEAVSLLLLVAIVGAVVVSKSRI